MDTNADGSTDTGDTDGDNLADYIDLDADNDGIPDLVEAGGIDINGDGRVDATTDADEDGLADIFDSNATDGPGVGGTNGTALVQTNGSGDRIDGATSASLDTDGDGRIDGLDLDADNDGIPDIVEAGASDPDNDGMVDTAAFPWDADGDGLADVYDENNADGPAGSGTNGTALIETSADTNADGRVNSTETMTAGGTNRINADGDGYPNHLDLDADNDGITDVVENASGNPDADNGGTGNLDGLVNNYTDSADNNGWNDSSNSSETDTDGDNIPDYLDIDADNDGIPDFIEGVCTTCPTAAGPSPTDTDSDGDGVLDIYENMTSDNTNNSTGTHTGSNPNIDDTSSNTNPDYLDTDADGDTAFDWSEGFDLNADGDVLEEIVGMAADYETANGNPGHYPTTDSDSDGIPDWMDNQPSTSGYIENNNPPFLNPANAAWIDQNNNGLADIFDAAMNGTTAPTPDANGATDDDDWRDMATAVFLPVELITFNAMVENCLTTLEWNTGSERNFDFFEIESSNNGIRFETLAVIDGRGDINHGERYTYTEEADKNLTYYRLKMIDLDGQVAFSNIITVQTECVDLGEINVYPNPISRSVGNLVIEILSGEVGDQLFITDVLGNVVLQQNLQDTNFTIEVNLSHLPSGTYFVRIPFGQVAKTKKFIILE